MPCSSRELSRRGSRGLEISGKEPSLLSYRRNFRQMVASRKSPLSRIRRAGTTPSQQRRKWRWRKAQPVRDCATAVIGSKKNRRTQMSPAVRNNVGAALALRSERSGSSHLRSILVNYDATHDGAVMINMHASTRFDHLFFDFAARFVHEANRFSEGVTDWISGGRRFHGDCFPRRERRHRPV